MKKFNLWFKLKASQVNRKNGTSIAQYREIWSIADVTNKQTKPLSGQDVCMVYLLQV